MKTLKIFIALLVLTSGFAKAQQFTKAELQVSGLTCAICSKSTEKALRTLPFISDIKTDLQRDIFILTFKNGTSVNFDQISKKVQESGFFVNSLKATYNFENEKIADHRFNYEGNTYQILNGTDKALSGPVALTLVDKSFASKSVSKRYLSQVKDIPVTSGKVYHVAI